MAKPSIVAALVLCLLTSAGLAGTAQGSFTVGIVIGKLKPHKAPKLRYTWGAAAISVIRAGYSGLRRIESSGNVYWFAAEREGAKFRVAVWIASGRIAAVIAA